MEISIDVIYQILTKWAKKQTLHTYTDLSNEYLSLTNEWHAPHGSWDQPLDKLANIISYAGHPPLTSLVILISKQEPGNDFWGCAPNVPSRPRNPLVRVTEWMKMVHKCYSHNWPVTLP
ncbi:hypothetical protein [Aeromonas allosaccharophila]|uniref:Uncharacterized protein n=1 Tax=Aeromonas allosaccharophila TaxID=656 RepID=A0AAX3NQD6_9GAMM|nr:hypothetical protein [Aeromonas allosaccharophila]WED76331.1 hypothetical protein PYU98_21015 [Aeromonas allosaccharophila]